MSKCLDLTLLQTMYLPWVRSRVWVRVGLGLGLGLGQASGEGWVGTWPETGLIQMFSTTAQNTKNLDRNHNNLISHVSSSCSVFSQEGNLWQFDSLRQLQPYIVPLILINHFTPDFKKYIYQQGSALLV